MKHLTDADFSLEDLCREVGYSYSHLFRLVKEQTGLKLTIYIRLIRLQVAEEFLKDVNLNIAEVAYRVGFQDPNYFARSFRQHYGVSPKVWRLQQLDYYMEEE